MVAFRLLTSAAKYVALSAQTAYRRLVVGVSTAHPYVTAAYTRLAAGVSSASLHISAAIGSFVKSLLFTDAATIIDQISRSFGKAKSDNVAATDAQVKSFGRSRDDAAVASDTMSRGAGKSFAENLAGTDFATKVAGKNSAEVALATDILARATSKALLDSPTATDLFLKAMLFPRLLNDTSSASDAATKTFGKAFADDVPVSDAQTTDIQNIASEKQFEEFVYATDDVNGASADDDQIIQFFKLRSDVALTEDNISIVASYSRVYSDNAYTLDISSKVFGSSRTDETVTLDTGFVKNQGYCDISYFMEDYVGATRTF